jgi:hypothetical protein
MSFFSIQNISIKFPSFGDQIFMPINVRHKKILSVVLAIFSVLASLTFIYHCYCKVKEKELAKTPNLENGPDAVTPVIDTETHDEVIPVAGAPDAAMDLLWKDRFVKDFKLSYDSPWEAMATHMQRTEEVDQDALGFAIRSFIGRIERKKFDKESKETLLNLLNQAYECKRQDLQNLILDTCQKYDQYVRQNPDLQLPPSPTFKEAYQIAQAQAKITHYHAILFKCSTGHQLTIKIPVRNGLFFQKDMQSAAIDELVVKGEIKASEKDEARKKVIIVLAGKILEDGSSKPIDEIIKVGNLHIIYKR